MRSTDTIDHIEAHIQALPAIYDRPAQKFIREILFGILMSKTTLLSEIARSICSKASQYPAIYKRIVRRCGEVNFEDLYVQQQNRAISEIKDNDIVAIDIGDITKPHSKTLEGLGKVADGSDDHKIKPGYWLCGAVTVDPSSVDKTPQPLSLKLYSCESETFTSENAVVIETIGNIYTKSNGKGIYTIDRGGDRSVILKYLFELKAKCIVRLSKRYLLDDDIMVEGEKNIIKIGKRNLERKNLPFKGVLLRMSRQGKRKPFKFRIDFKKVSIASLPTDQQLYLVTAWGEKSKNPIELLTTVPVENEQDAINILIGYLSRWSVEETYRFLKTDSNLEKVQLRSLGKIKNMIKLTFIAASILARMALNDSCKVLCLRNVKRQKRPSFDLFNWLYMIADLCVKIIPKNIAAILKKNETIYFKHCRRPLEKLGLFEFEVGL